MSVKAVPYDAVGAEHPPTTCVAGGCERTVAARGMCLMHYKRFQKYGRLDLVHSAYGSRPEVIRLRRKMWARWERISKKPHGWESRVQFIADIGEPPDWRYHQLAPIDKSKPIGPGNFQWVARKDQRVSRVVVDRKSSEYHRSTNVKRYGLSLTDYGKLLDAQGGVCAICKRAETATKFGRVMPLAVDHCHASKVVRGLLCANCNRMLGLSKDNPDVLRSGAAYLERG